MQLQIFRPVHFRYWFSFTFQDWEILMGGQPIANTVIGDRVVSILDDKDLAHKCAVHTWVNDP